MDRKVVHALNELSESCRFMKGLFSWVGFRTGYIEYSRPARLSGKTKFGLWNLWNFALDGITGFSTVPLRIWTYLGLFFSIISFFLAVITFIKNFLYGVDVPGYASTIIMIIFLGGINLIGIGVIGEYLGRTYMESKRRPLYIIREIFCKKS